MHKFTTTRLVAMSGVAIAVAGIAPAAYSQNEVANPSSSNEQLTEIIVTGTRIRGAAPVGSNLVSIDAAQLVELPASNVVEMLNKDPVFSGIGNNEAVKRAVGPGVTGTNAMRGSDINLRGIGPNATLVLFDGMRAPPTGATGRNLDASVIPSAVIERVEVVADGASAIYGSDAIAGVVNFVPRRSYDGVEARVRVGYAQGDYDSRQASLMLGHEWDRGGFVAAYEHRHNSTLSGTELDWYRSDLRPWGGEDYRSNQCNPGTIVVGSTTYAVPEGGVTPATASLLQPGTSNLCEIVHLADVLPENTTHTGYVSFVHSLTDWLDFRIGGVYSKREVELRDVDVGSQNLRFTVTVPNTNAFFVAPPGTNPSSVRVNYFFGKDVDLLKLEGFQDLKQAQAGLEFTLPGDWNGSLDYAWSEAESVIGTLGVHTASLNAALASADPNTAFNVFGGPNSPSVIAEVFTQNYDPSARHRTHQAQLQANGSLLDLPGGALKLAAGLEYYRLNNYNYNRFGDVRTIEQNLSASDLKRSVESAYAELLIPIVGVANAVMGVRSVDLSLALRHDDYSDVGSTTNPKFGINWRPLDGLLLKGSYGTSFRAPSLSQTVAPSVSAQLIYQTLSDPQAPGGSSSGVVWLDSNPTLEPEEATTWSVSAEIQPVALPDLRVTATYFSIDYDGLIGSFTRNTALQDPALAPFVTRNPSAQEIAALEALGLRQSGVRPPVINWIIDARPQNLGGVRLKGLDAQAQYVWRLGAGDITAAIGGTYNTHFSTQVLPNTPFIDQLDQIYSPLRLRMRGKIGWQSQGFSADAYVNYTAGYENHLVTPVQDVGSYSTMDLRVGYNFDGVASALSGTSVSIEMLNVLDEEPTFVDVDGGADLTVASALGRMFSLTLVKRW